MLRLFTYILPLACALALLALWLGGRRAPAAELPSFTPASPPDFPPLAAPLGSSALRGRVVDAAGDPLEAASVYLRAYGVPRWAHTGADGRFEIEDLPAEELDLVVVSWPLPLGRFRATAGSSEARLVMPPAEPDPPGLPDVPRAPLAGRVLGAGSAWGDPEGYEVVLTPQEGPEHLQGPVQRRVATDGSGVFAVPDLALGEYRVAVLPAWARGGSWPDLSATWSRHLDHRPLRPTAGEEPEGTSLELQLAAGAIEGRLFGDRTLEPVEGAFCLVVDAAQPGKIWPPVVSTHEGRFRVRTLPPGDYLLSVRAGEGALVEVPVTVRPGEVARPELEPLTVRAR